MTHPPEPYAARHITHIGNWTEVGHVLKVYALHYDKAGASHPLPEAVRDAAQASVRGALEDSDPDQSSHELGFCILHIGQDAVWLLVDWWVPGGIVCQRMFSAPLTQPDQFQPVKTPALACVWELVVTAHERNAWVRHMMSAKPDAPAYLDDTLAAGWY